MSQAYWYALLGGVLIGISVSLMLLLRGRVTGISGIIDGAMNSSPVDRNWRWFFIFGLVCGGIVMFYFRPEFFENSVETPAWTLVVAGLLVGFGTLLGSGCTSGHGVCGISRLSPRSLVATLTFIFSGVVIVSLLRMLGGFGW